MGLKSPCSPDKAPRSTWRQNSLRDRISLVNTDTIAIIVAILGVGLGLWRAIASIRQDVDSRHKDLRQHLAEIRQELRALHARIDAFYQALFSRKDPAA